MPLLQSSFTATLTAFEGFVLLHLFATLAIKHTHTHMLQAASHVHRFLSLDENLLREAGPDPKKADSFASSMHVLQQASSDLQQVIIEGFNKAMLAREHANIERFAPEG